METLDRRCRRVNRGQDDDTGTQHNERSLQVFYEPGGTLVLHARLPTDKGALILKAMDQGSQDVSAETSAASEKPEKEPFDQRRADTLTDIAESYLAKGPTVSSAGDRYQVLLHVSAETSRRLCCDTIISVVTEDRRGETLKANKGTDLFFYF